MEYETQYQKPKKCSQFSFQKMNKYFLLPFFVPIVCFSTKFFSETMKTNDDKIDIKNVTTDNTHTFVFMYQIIQSLCLVLGGLLYFITSCKFETNEVISRRGSDASSENSENKILRYLSRNSSLGINEKDRKKPLIVIFMPFLLILYNMSIAYGVKHPQLEKRVYFLIFIILINVFIFKKQLFKHHKLALIITMIGAIPIYTAFGVYLDTEKYNILYDIFLFLGSFCYSVYLVFIKYLTLNKQMPVFLLLFYQGILCTIFTLIIFSIISLIAKHDFTYISNIFNCNKEN